MALSFAQLKAAIIALQKTVEVCDTLHDVQIATDEDELIAAGLPLVVYAYQTGIVDDTLLLEFTEAKLNAAGIYTTGTFVISNPTDEVYILKTADVTLTVDGNNKAKINVLGSGVLTLTASDDAYVTVRVYNTSTVGVTINDRAIVDLFCRDAGNVTVTQNDDSILHMNGTSTSIIHVTTNNQSYALVKMYNNSTLVYEFYDTSVIDAQAFQKATISDISP